MTTIQDKIRDGRYSGTVPFVSYKDDVSKNLLYHQNQRQMRELFKQELLAEFGLTNHPKASLAFRMAWEEGHANGFSEVANYFEGLAELMT